MGGPCASLIEFSEGLSILDIGLRGGVGGWPARPSLASLNW